MTEIILKVLVSNRKACVIVLTSCMSLHTQTKKKKTNVVVRYNKNTNKIELN